MKVKELISELLKYPSEADVIVRTRFQFQSYDIEYKYSSHLQYRDGKLIIYNDTDGS